MVEVLNITTASMVSAKHEAALRNYLSLMAEAKVRLKHLEESIEAHSASEGWTLVIARESCFLQVRMLCELTAMACLVAHGDIKKTEGKDFQRAWQAPKIINGLAALHPEFYPRPVMKKGTATKVDFITSGFLTSIELVDLWTRCGKALHRGSIKAFKEGRSPQQDLSIFPSLHSKFFTLLNQHYMRLVDAVWVVYCQMNDENGKVAVGQMFDFNSLPALARLLKGQP